MRYRKGKSNEEFEFDPEFGGVVFTFLEALIFARLAIATKSQEKFQDVIIDTLDIDNDHLIMAPEQWYQVINYQCTPPLTWDEFRGLTNNQLEEIKKKFREVTKGRNWLGENMKLHQKLIQDSPTLTELRKILSDLEAVKNIPPQTAS